MLTFISCAKTMSMGNKTEIPFVTKPVFQEHANEQAIELAQLSTSEIEKDLNVNTKIATTNHLRYTDFFSDNTPSAPALIAYSGIVFKKINPDDFSYGDFLFTQKSLRITSFLYGLLRPLDLIKPYRLEGKFQLQCNEGKNVFDYWKDILTDYFIKEIKDNGNILINLASDEMKELFHWNKIEESVKVITPSFKVNKGGKLKTIVIYTKMCRGEMVRYIIKNRIKDHEQLKNFRWEGFSFNPELSDESNLLFNIVS